MSRVLTLAPMPAEKCAYALARYSRSPDSIRESIEWVKTHDSAKFLESFYFQYGHGSIADLGHLVLCLEGVYALQTQHEMPEVRNGTVSVLKIEALEELRRVVRLDPLNRF